MNPIQKVVQARITSLLAQSASADAINHMTTKGMLREKYLAEFLKDLIPQSLSITS